MRPEPLRLEEGDIVLIDRFKTRKQFQERMLKAAGIASAQVICAPATWDAVRWMSLPPLANGIDLSSFTLPSEPAEDGLITITLTGPKLSSLLVLVRSKQYMGSVTEKPLANRLYDLLGAALDTVSLTGGTKRLEPVVLDHRVE
jgi:hypothetical protein